MSTDTTDIADLVAKLDALEKEATPSEWEIIRNGTIVGYNADLGSIAVAVPARLGNFEANTALIVALRNGWPKELRRIVVAAKDYADAYRKWKDLWDAWYAAFKETGEDEWDSLQQAHEEMNSAHDALLAVRGEA